ncbi:CLUMA_CG009493, isoform A [Clunio marinus]|uniref:CLUMA_CG009493, isoform A n=1 Tax=Clunio marinus TaxID=568069 RepID=A0A1J1I727_9DIPT|nr:CLUMA_CG009493, isoform A [Clunio marinus]
MWKIATIFLIVFACVNAKEDVPEKTGRQTSSLVKAILCYVSPTPWNCLKEQTGRMLDNLEDSVEQKRHELLVQADEEMKEKETSRGASNDEKTELPSEVMGALDRGVSEMSDLITGKGKKGKKGKKGLMKMFFLGAIIKSKIELLLKILSFHLQLKFFAVALASLMINLARFWIDLKKAPHKHHYDHDHDDWGSSWKRQSNNQDYNSESGFAHRLAYSNQPYPQQYQQQF